MSTPDSSATSLVIDDTHLVLRQKGFSGEAVVRREFNDQLDGTELASGGLTAVPWQFTGTHSGLFEGIAPTHRSVTIQGVTILDQARGLHYRYVDWLNVLAQLGVALAYRTPGLPDEGDES